MKWFFSSSFFHLLSHWRLYHNNRFHILLETFLFSKTSFTWMLWFFWQTLFLSIFFYIYLFWTLIWRRLYSKHHFCEFWFETKTNLCVSKALIKNIESLTAIKPTHGLTAIKDSMFFKASLSTIFLNPDLRIKPTSM